MANTIADVCAMSIDIVRLAVREDRSFEFKTGG